MVKRAAHNSVQDPVQGPIQTVGVIGGGQLAWMLAKAARSLGIKLIVQTPQMSDPAVAEADGVILAAVDDAEATAQLADRVQVITFENEFVDRAALAPLVDRGVCFRPALGTLAPLLDKYDQRQCLQALGLPVPRFQALPPSPPQVLTASGLQPGAIPLLQALPQPFPIVLKARRHGYDGQGTLIIPDAPSLAAQLHQWAAGETWQPQPLLEELIPFEQELAVIAARSLSGEVVCFPIVETYQAQQVCRWVLAPADLPPDLVATIEAIATRLLHHLQAVGLFGLELFLTREQQVIVNEIAPRTHNSGHFSIDACHTSQFEQHLRAVCGLPLGNPALKGAGAVMINLLGYESGALDQPPLADKYAAIAAQLQQLPNAHLHWYGKTLTRPGRKLGHVTVGLTAPTPAARRQEALGIIQTVNAIWQSPAA